MVDDYITRDELEFYHQLQSMELRVRDQQLQQLALKSKGLERLAVGAFAGLIAIMDSSNYFSNHHLPDYNFVDTTASDPLAIILLGGIALVEAYRSHRSYRSAARSHQGENQLRTKITELKQSEAYRDLFRP